MKTFNTLSVALVAAGLAIFAGSYIFAAGSLTILGWSIMAPLFAGSVGQLIVVVSGLIPDSAVEAVKNVIPSSEKNDMKPATNVG